MVFLAIVLDRHLPLPKHLAHRLTTAETALVGAVVTTHQTPLQVLASPVRGAAWLAADGPGNDVDNHHRRGTLVLNGVAVDSRRFAIDWKKVEGGVSFAGDRRNVQSYFCYGQPVFAVADGQVIYAQDGLPNNVPGHGAEFQPAVPLDFNTIGGNRITLAIGDKQFAYYLHLQPGRLRVKQGDFVKKGQLLAAIGASGDAREPHLHFEVTTSPQLILGEGVPYLLDQYHANSGPNGALELHKRELPLDKQVVNFLQ